MGRAVWVVTVVLVGSAAAAAQEHTAQAASEDDEADVPEVALPGSPGTVTAGKGSVAAGRIAVVRPPERGAEASTKDLPTWLGELLGLKKPPPPDDAQRTPAKRHLTVIPFVSSSPVTGVGFGVAAAGTTQHGEPENTSLSTYSLSFTITTQSQYALTNRHDLRFAGDEWGLTGMARWTKWPSPTWGIGGNTPESAKSTLDYQLIRLYELLSRRLFGSLYVGAGYSFDWYFSVRNSGSASGQPTDFSTYPYGTGPTSLNSGPALSLVWDTRDSPVYPTSGIIADFNYTFLPKWLGSGSTWHDVYLDLRTYHQLTRWLVLALWTYGSFTFGQVPYLELASNGSDPNERAARGYVQGRHIGKSLLYGEAELRFTIWQWLGAVAGVNVHSVSEPDGRGILGDNPRFRYWYPAVTGGLRFLIVKETRSNLCLDYGVGKEGQRGFYLSFNEAF
jgi:Omp85 superfamily domain